MYNTKITKCGGRGGHFQHVKMHFSDCGKSPWKVATLWLSTRSPGYQTGSSFQQLQSTECQMECSTLSKACL